MGNFIQGAVLTVLAAGVMQANAEAIKDQEQERGITEVVVVGEPSTFGATKSNTPVMETPRSISIIPADQFLDRGSLSISNALDYTAGVTGAGFGFATRGDFISIRGLDAPVYQDNLQVLFGFYNNTRADVYTIEQIEVLKGPASVLYGQAAPGGIVSTISKIAGPDNLDKEIVLTAGSYDRYQGGVDVGFDLTGDGTWTARLVGVYRESDTQVDFVNDDAIVFAPSITYQNDSTSITALLNYTDRESDTSHQFLPLTATGCANSDVSISAPTVCANAPGREVDHTVYVGDPNFNKYNTESTTFSLIGVHQINDIFSVEGTARYRDNEAEYNQTWISFLGDGNPRLLPDGTAAARSWSSSPGGSTQSALDARLRAIFDTGPVQHEVLGGVNYQDVDTYVNRAFLYGQPTTFNIYNPVYDGSEVPSAAVFDSVRVKSENETVATDFYLTNQMNIGNLIVNAGIRSSSVESKDAGSDQDDQETPISFAAMYKTGLGLNPYVSYAESFRVSVGTDVVTNTPLKPRGGEQTEIGVKYQPEGSESSITVAYFDLEEDNLLVFVGGGGSTQPGMSIETEGFEVEAELVWDDLSVDFDFRHLEADNVAPDGSRFTRPSLPENSGSVWVNWQPTTGALEGFRFGAGARYENGNESSNPPALSNVVETDGFTVFDAMVGYQIDSFDFMLNFRNLGDEEYYSTCLSRGDCFPGEQRTIVGTMAVKF